MCSLLALPCFVRNLCFPSQAGKWYTIRHLECELSTCVTKRIGMPWYWVSLFLAVACGEVIFDSPPVEGITGHAFCNQQAPAGASVMLTFGLGTNATSSPITWNVGDFTGFYPNPRASPGKWQVGVNNDWYGSTALQMQGKFFGAELHTYSSNEHSPYNLANAQYAYSWAGNPSGENLPRPWLHQKSLLITTTLQVPTCWVEGGIGSCAYTSVILLLKDMVSKQHVCEKATKLNLRSGGALELTIREVWNNSENMLCTTEEQPQPRS